MLRRPGESPGRFPFWSPPAKSLAWSGEGLGGKRVLKAGSPMAAMGGVLGNETLRLASWTECFQPTIFNLKLLINK